MNYDEESYTSAVNNQWEKLANAQTNEEIQEVLDTWPEKKSFEIKEEDDKNSDSNEQPTVDKLLG